MNSRVALITFLDGNGSFPDNTLPSQPAYPSNALPGGGDINNSLPKPPGSIATLPVFPFDPSAPRPDNSLPGQGQGSTLPVLHPGMKLVVKFIACYGFVGVIDNELPDTPEPK